MGWKLSFVFIENAAQERDDSILLNCIKKTDYSYQSTLTLNDFHRLEKGILIGEIDNHIIISDNYELSGKILERRK